MQIQIWQQRPLFTLAIIYTAKNNSRGLKVNKNILPVILIFTVTGCASSKAVGTIKETSAKNVEYCDYIANVSGTSGWGGLASSSGIENAKEQAKQKAIDSGATHIVWQNINGGYSPSVSANTYKCETK